MILVEKYNVMTLTSSHLVLGSILVHLV